MTSARQGQARLVPQGGHAEVGQLDAEARRRRRRRPRRRPTTSTLAGFTSRCTTPTAWAASSASSTPSPMRAARPARSGPALAHQRLAGWAPAPAP